MATLVLLWLLLLMLLVVVQQQFVCAAYDLSAWEAQVLVQVEVNNLQDDFPPQAENCRTNVSSSPSPSNRCNLRSAWALCLSLQQPSQSLCSIVLPEKVMVVINGTRGPLTAMPSNSSFSPFRVSITGSGSTISSVRDSSSYSSSSVMLLETIPVNASDTDSATRNTVVAWSASLCQGDIVSFVAVSSDTTTLNYNDPYFRFYDNDSGLEVMYSDDAAALMPYLIFQAPNNTKAGTCRSYSLHVGCYANTACDVYVEVYSGAVQEDNRFIYFLDMMSSSSVDMSLLSLNNMTIEKFGSHYGNGGAIYAEGRLNLTIFDVIFDSNVGNYGGAIFVSNNTIGGSISRLLFKNQSSQSGGAVYMDKQCQGFILSHLHIVNSSAVKDGGAIVLNTLNHDIIIKSIVAMNVQSHEGSGGTIMINEANFNVTLLDLNLNEVSTALNGGGIAINSNNVNIFIVGCNIRDSTSTSGGGIYIGSYNQLVIIMSSIFDRCASENDVGYNSNMGGAIALFQHNDQCIIWNTTILSCTARYGGGIALWNNNSFITVMDVVVVGNIELDPPMYGGGIYIGQTNPSFAILNVSFEQTLASTGGGVYVSIANLYGVISGCTFLAPNEEFYYGGGIYVNSQNHFLLISNGTFSNYIASESGGGVYIETNNDYLSIVGNQFINCSASFNGGGLALDKYNNNSRIVANVFYRCYVQIVGGGGVEIYEANSNLLFRNNQVIECYSTYEVSSGMGMHVADLHQNIVIENSLFVGSVDSFGGYGGCLAIDGPNTMIVIQSTTFTNCSAFSDGGAISISSGNSYVTIESCIFDNCWSGGYGGAIFVGQQNNGLQLISNSFNNNKAVLAGGALYIYQNNNDGEIVSCEFNGNQAPLGGAISFNTSNYRWIIGGSVLKNNEATLNGGAVYSYSANSYLTIIDSTGYNYTVVDGVWGAEIPAQYYEKNISVPGASSYIFGFTNIQLDEYLYIYLYVDGVLISSWDDISTVFPGINEQYTILEGHNITIIFRVTYDATCYYADGCGFSYFVNPIINAALTSTTPTLISNNLAGGKGGGIFFYSNNQYVNIINTCITHNSALTSGGGIFSQLIQSAFIFASSVFESNAAKTNGGGLVILAGCFAHQFVSNIFSNNTAQQSGGGIYLGTSNGEGSFASNNQIMMNANTFSGNAAAVSGGGLYLDGENIFQLLEENVFVSNTAKSNGGALFLNSLNTFEVSGVSFSMNLAAMCGGAIASFSSNNIVFMGVPSNITSNTANQMGGGICIKSSTQMSVDTPLTLNYNEAFFGGAIGISGADLWNVQGNGSVLIVGNHAARGSGLFCHPLLGGKEKNSLKNVSFVDNVATGGTVYWIVDSAMTAEPPGLNNPTVTFVNNSAAYGVIRATQAVQLIVPTVYEVMDYGSTISPPPVAYLMDFYGQVVDIDNDTTLFISLATTSAPQCGDFLASVAGNDIAGVVLTHGLAVFSNTILYCDPLGNFTVQFEADLGDNAGIPLQIGESYYLKNYTFITFRSCEDGEYEKNGQCVVCPEGTFSLGTNLNEDSCQDCTKTVGVETCYGDQISLAEGYWRRYDSSSAVLSCPMGPASCKGGNATGEALCLAGYTGPLCSVCDVNYYSTESTCQTCSGGGAVTPTMIVIFSLLSLLGSLVVFYMYFMDLMHQGSPSQIEVAFLWLKSQYGEFTVKLKIIISTYQIVTAVGTIMAIQMPKAFRSFTSIFNFCNLNLSSLFPLGCATGFNFMDELLLTTLAPIVLTLVILMFFSIEYFYLRQQIQKNLNRQKGDKAKQFDTTKNKYLNYFFYLTYLILPSVTTTIFQLFVCQNIDPNNEDSGQDDYFLVADMSISCQSTYYDNWVLYGVLMILVYPIGIPTMYFLLLYYNRQELMLRDSPTPLLPPTETNGTISKDEDKNLKVSNPLNNETVPIEEKEVSPTTSTPKALSAEASRLSFLWRAYEPKYWYWELIETGRRITLTAVLSVISPGSSEQNLLSILLALLFIKLYSSCGPYVKVRNDTLAEIGQAQILITFLCALTLNNNLLATKWAAMMEGFLIFGNLGVMMFVTYNSVETYLSSHAAKFDRLLKPTNDIFEAEAQNAYNEAMVKLDENGTESQLTLDIEKDSTALKHFPQDIELSTFSKQH